MQDERRSNLPSSVEEQQLLTNTSFLKVMYTLAAPNNIAVVLRDLDEEPDALHSISSFTEKVIDTYALSDISQIPFIQASANNHLTRVLTRLGIIKRHTEEQVSNSALLHFTVDSDVLRFLRQHLAIMQDAFPKANFSFITASNRKEGHTLAPNNITRYFLQQMLRKNESDTIDELFFSLEPSKGRIDISPLFRGENNLLEKPTRRNVHRYLVTEAGQDTIRAIHYIASHISFL